MSKNNKSLFTRRDFIRDSTLLTAGAAFASGIWPVISESSDTNEDARKWFMNINRQLILETHFGNYKEIFNNFDAEAAAQMYEEAGVDLLCYFGKCQNGYSYYPTKIGVEHPGLNRDFTGELTEALKKRGIRCMVYFFPAMERRLQKIHPDWIYHTDYSSEIPEESSFDDVAMMCFQSPYMDEIGIPQMKECLVKYNFDGVFVDIVMQQFLSNNCYCRYCRELYNNEVGGVIPTDKNDPGAFIYRKWSNRHMETFIDKIQHALDEPGPEIAVIINYAWMSRYPVTPPEYVPHVTWDTPTPANGLFSLDFSFESRYLSSLPDVSWSCMNVRMNNWTDYSLRETEAFLHECAIPLGACGTLYQSDV
ncbi:MAG: twin-arginine translocation signal domain-containing protein, partial [Candidatus Latescibacteria bacterium]|nr:twin-arginine translocation signal domain-containing protein [Candidatus Latescibacterota bacterium]